MCGSNWYRERLHLILYTFRIPGCISYFRIRDLHIWKANNTTTKKHSPFTALKGERIKLIIYGIDVLLIASFIVHLRADAMEEKWNVGLSGKYLFDIFLIQCHSIVLKYGLAMCLKFIRKEFKMSIFFWWSLLDSKYTHIIHAPTSWGFGEWVLKIHTNPCINFKEWHGKQVSMLKHKQSKILTSEGIYILIH